jgi:hypothetical protein
MANVANVEFRNAVEKIGEYARNFTGSKPVFTEPPNLVFPLAKTDIRFGNVTIGVFVMLLPGKTAPDVTINVTVCHFPKENLVAFFRQLLNWNNLETDVAHFYINDQLGTVQLGLKRPVQDFDYSEFVHTVQTISSLTMNYVLILTKQWGITN